MIISSMKRYDFLKKEIISKSNLINCEIEKKTFPDGEVYHRIIEPFEKIKGMEVLLIGSTMSDSEAIELFDIANQFISMGAKKLHVWIPFYGYQTMERAVNGGEIVKAKTRALILSSIPKAPLGNFFYSLDLHSEGIPYYFENGSKLNHIYSKKLFLNSIKDTDNLVIGSADSGRAKWIESLANELGVEGCFVFKKRIDEKTTAITGINANVNGKRVIIFDDMIRTGSSIIDAIQSYKKAGAIEISVFTTHPVFFSIFEKDNLDNFMKKVGCKIYTTNSTGEFYHPNVETFSIADLIMDSIK